MDMRVLVHICLTLIYLTAGCHLDKDEAQLLFRSFNKEHNSQHLRNIIDDSSQAGHQFFNLHKKKWIDNNIEEFFTNQNHDMKLNNRDEKYPNNHNQFTRQESGIDSKDFSTNHQQLPFDINARKSTIFNPEEKFWTIENIPSALPPDESIFSTDQMPTNERLWPEMGNGHLAGVVYGDVMFMNGLYNGAGVKTSRARIPATSSYSIVNVSLPLTNITYSLDVGRGVFTERRHYPNVLVEQVMFAHRLISELMVTVVSMKWINLTPLPNTTVTMTITPNFNQESDDLTLSSSTLGGIRYLFGYIKTPETSESGHTPVHMYFNPVTDSLAIDNFTIAISQAIISSVSVSQEAAFEALERGFQMFGDDLLSSHCNAWLDVWNRGRIDLEGDLLLSQVTYGSLYYLYSSLPVVENLVWPFVGLAPGGLAHGSLSSDYAGHIFWDQETWMYPTILMLNSTLGKKILLTRIRTLDAAKANAKSNGYEGAQFPWESALSGLEVSPSSIDGKHEVHITADVALAFQQYVFMEHDTYFLLLERGLEAIDEIAKYWVSRSNYNFISDQYEIFDVVGPDEYHTFIDNSAYTNAAARNSLLLADFVYNITARTPPAIYRTVADKMYIPFDEQLKYHPEFDGYESNITVKQADVILLGYPLMYNMSNDVRKADLDIYRKVTDPGGPAMTWGMFSLGYLELDNLQQAEKDFRRGILNVQEPFQVWTEVATGAGAVNFQTGMGGYLQSLLFGFGGFRIKANWLEFNPKLPAGCSQLGIVHLDYLGNSLKFRYNMSDVNITMIAQVDPLFVMTNSGSIYPLKLNIPVIIKRQAGVITVSRP